MSPVLQYREQGIPPNGGPGRSGVPQAVAVESTCCLPQPALQPSELRWESTSAWEFHRLFVLCGLPVMPCLESEFVVPAPFTETLCGHFY